MTITADRARASITGQRYVAEMVHGYARAWTGAPDAPLTPGTGD